MAVPVVFTCARRVVPGACEPLWPSHVSCYVMQGRKDALFMANICSNDVRSSSVVPHSNDRNIIILPGSGVTTMPHTLYYRGAQNLLYKKQIYKQN